jgi:hypothetical protein
MTWKALAKKYEERKRLKKSMVFRWWNLEDPKGKMCIYIFWEHRVLF